MSSPVISRRRSRMLVVSPDAGVAAAVHRALAARPLGITELDDMSALAGLPDAVVRQTLVALLDVDVPGAWEAIAAEERLGGRLFGVTLLVVSSRPLRHPTRDDGEPPPWSAAFTRPIPPLELLRVIDREIAFENYGSDLVPTRLDGR